MKKKNINSFRMEENPRSLHLDAVFRRQDQFSFYSQIFSSLGSVRVWRRFWFRIIALGIWCRSQIHIQLQVQSYLLDLDLVSGSCQRIQDDSSPHYSVQYECLQLASGFNSCIYQQELSTLCSSRAPTGPFPWTGFQRITLDSGSNGWYSINK